MWNDTVREVDNGYSRRKRWKMSEAPEYKWGYRDHACLTMTHQAVCYMRDLTYSLQY